MKAINYKTIAILSLLVFAFLLGFSLSVQAYRISQQELNNPVSQYLRENYGVNSVEEYEAKLEQEAWLNYSRQMEALASEYPELNLPQSYMQAGTSTYQPPTLKSEPFYAVVFNEPVLALQVFSLSGLGLLGLTAVPPVKKRKQLRQAVIIGVVVLCIFSIGYFTGYTVAQTGTISIEPASLSGDYSYLIETDGTYVWAKSGKTGEVVYGGQWNAGGVSGTDAASVIQSALNATSSVGGGMVFVKRGEYTLNRQITIKDNVSLVGEGMFLTKFKVNFTIQPYRGAIESPDPPNYVLVKNVVLMDFELDGRDTVLQPLNKNGIYLKSVQNALIQNVYIHNISGWGIGIVGRNANPSFDVLINCCRVSDTYWDNVMISGGDDLGTSRVTVVNSFFTHGDGGVINWGSEKCIIANNVFKDIFSPAPNNVAICPHHGSRKIVIANNVIYGTSGTKMNGIEVIDSNTYDILIIGNLIDLPASISGGEALGIAGQYCTAKGNIIIRDGSTGMGSHIQKNNFVIGNLFMGNLTSEHILYADGENCVFRENVFLNVFRAIAVRAPNCLIADNQIIDTDHTHTDRGMTFYTETVSPNNNVVRGNLFRNIDTAVRLENGNNNAFVDNVFDNCTSVFYIAGGISGTEIKHNMGYVTENSGTATISSGTSVVVTHGLAGTPTVVTVTPRSTGYGTFAVTDRNSTTFTITVTTSGTYTFDWYAEYKP
jgi:hypothetical protein